MVWKRVRRGQITVNSTVKVRNDPQSRFTAKYKITCNGASYKRTPANRDLLKCFVYFQNGTGGKIVQNEGKQNATVEI